MRSAEGGREGGREGDRETKRRIERETESAADLLCNAIVPRLYKNQQMWDGSQRDDVILVAVYGSSQVNQPIRDTAIDSRFTERFLRDLAH
jgi:hypothetical protein